MGSVSVPPVTTNPPAAPALRDRFDALANDGDRSALFHPADLVRVSDPLLQAIVAEASAVAGAPIGLVSLVLDRSQQFRAQIGLPDGLAAAQATDRDVSFCQVVVATREPLAVPRAEGDPRVPQHLVQSHGVQAYLGVPLDLGGGPIGTLCVIDTRPRPFTDAEVSALQALAHKAEERLLQLRGEAGIAFERLLRAAEPTFAELRNILTVLQASLSSARMAASELESLTLALRQGEREVRAMLDGGTRAHGDLVESLQDLEQAVPRLVRSVQALQQAASRGLPTRVSTADLIHDATGLALHYMRLLGPLEPATGDTYQATIERGRATAALASVLSEVAMCVVTARGRGGLRIRTTRAEGRVEVRVHHHAIGEAELLERTRPLRTHDATVEPRIVVEGAEVVLSMPA